ncbi:fungal cellulose binding domain-containing protein [Plectosphaerella plurivora]|uniref:Fungal cellulose binding domain-containing protein n=1 Tax=Plectosphaerella plurivora TaxID=936078 RepID=A0A9P8VMJ6_9PEZI|nr:fungal cellulose binding domain-containing protein [Plectosphaerella plurivora]
MVFSRVGLSVVLSALAVSAARIAPCTTGTKYFFNFGDSYSQTGFNINGQKPTASNPFGNPPVPGWTASGGLNWVGFMASEYNAGDVRTFNFAYGGATTDADLVTPYAPEVLSFEDQVDLFLDNVAVSPKPEWAPWTAANSIAGVWIGVNDVGNTFWLPDLQVKTQTIIDRYFELLQSLYDAGLRNFVLLSVPPTNRAPAFWNQGPDTSNMVANGIDLYNTALETALNEFKTANAGVTSWLIDTAAPFNQALDNPTEYGSPDATCWKEDGVSCLWFNDYHPGIEINRLVGAEVARVVGAPFFEG